MHSVSAALSHTCWPRLAVFVLVYDVVEKTTTHWREDGGVVVEKKQKVDKLSIKILVIYLQQ